MSPEPFAFLLLRDHPYGREMLAALLEAGHAPCCVLEEDSAVAEEERAKFEVRTRGMPSPPAMSELLQQAGDPPVRGCPTHNDPESIAWMESHQPTLIVLGGTRILKPYVWAKAADGCVNAHPGLLPELRGSASVAWAVHYDLPIGCTTHFIEAGVDTGPIIERETIPVRRGATYPELCAATQSLSARMMARALNAWSEGTLKGVPQAGDGRIERNMPEAMVRDVEAKLAAGTYAHYVKGASA